MTSRENALREAFHGAGRRLTAQRRLIMEVLEESEGHLDAETLHDRVRARNPGISLATVYRTLAVLEDMGRVEKHSLGEDHSHYETVRDAPHYHFSCLGCGRVIEFDAPEVARVIRRLGEQEGVQVTEAHLTLSGYCARCREVRR
ncbi:MAG: transcriptional repressor [Anaerolineae bacterium]|nr:transcriptional repressor [Anaerolineae bacterium]